MTVGLVRVEWSGTTGGPGLTQFAIAASGGATWTAANAQSAVDAVRTFFSNQIQYIPNEVQLQVLPDVDQYDELTATLEATTTAAVTPASLAGTGTGSYAGGAGYRYNWRTGVIRGGRRVVGKTYIVPAVANVYDANGTLGSTQITSFNQTASTFLATLSAAGLGLQVWSRPGGIAVPVGGMSGVITGDVADKTAILRTRRD